ncbi:LuxR C-terminal-related transcriptional regulator [Streptomyces sp. CWNU-52B]|uniref:LuxR C-terminal-related transcriptional regulator n=1 Tax=unclassified Streptomyces TaxID=2593676 RepID=UPI0039BF1375
MADTVQGAGTRVVVIESVPLILGGLRSALEDDGIAVVAATHDPQSGMRTIRQERPDVVVVDLDLPGRTGLGLLQQVRRQAPASRLVASVSPERDDDRLLLASLLAGATGYLLKTAQAVDLLRTVRAVQRGYVTLGPRAGGDLATLLTRLTEADEALPFPALTDREREVLRLVSLGYGNRRIAQELFISEKTVRNYVSTILPKIHVSSRLEAIVSARLAGLETASPGTGSVGAQAQGRPG